MALTKQQLYFADMQHTIMVIIIFQRRDCSNVMLLRLLDRSCLSLGASAVKMQLVIISATTFATILCKPQTNGFPTVSATSSILDILPAPGSQYLNRYHSTGYFLETKSLPPSHFPRWRAHSRLSCHHHSLFDFIIRPFFSVR